MIAGRMWPSNIRNVVCSMTFIETNKRNIAEAEQSLEESRRERTGVPDETMQQNDGKWQELRRHKSDQRRIGDIEWSG